MWDDTDVRNNPPTLPQYITYCEGEVDYIKKRASEGKKVYLKGIFPITVHINDEDVTMYLHRVTDAKTGEQIWIEDPEVVARRIYENRKRRCLQ